MCLLNYWMITYSARSKQVLIFIVFFQFEDEKIKSYCWNLAWPLEKPLLTDLIINMTLKDFLYNFTLVKGNFNMLKGTIAKFC